MVPLPFVIKIFPLKLKSRNLNLKNQPVFFLIEIFLDFKGPKDDIKKASNSSRVGFRMVVPK
jgi:hypothetical protein